MKLLLPQSKAVIMETPALIVPKVDRATAVFKTIIRSLQAVKLVILKESLRGNGFHTLIIVLPRLLHEYYLPTLFVVNVIDKYPVAYWLQGVEFTPSARPATFFHSHSQ